MHPIQSPALQPLLAQAEEVARTVTAVHSDEDDRLARWPEATMHALAQAGLMGLLAPLEAGGHGQGMLALASVCEIIGRESPSAALCFGMHCVGTAVIAAKATPAQFDRYLVPIARGEHLTTLALSEPGSGSFFFYPETRLEARGDGFVVDGAKSFVTNGTHAHSYVVSVAAPDRDEPEGSFSCAVVDSDQQGQEWSEPWTGLGMRSNESRTVRLDHVLIDGDQLLGAQGDQLWYVFEVVAPYFLMAMAGTYLGAAQGAMAEARAHVGTRRYTHTGELQGAAPVVSHRLGDMWIRLESTRQLVYSAAGGADAGAPDALYVVLACKAAAGDTAVSLANDAMTLAGGSAYRENARLARILRDARASHVMAPTTDILKTWLGRALIGLPLL
jgi:isovaleryl-CoA dehydrogenase